MANDRCPWCGAEAYCSEADSYECGQHVKIRDCDGVRPELCLRRADEQLRARVVELEAKYKALCDKLHADGVYWNYFGGHAVGED